MSKERTGTLSADACMLASALIQSPPMKQPSGPVVVVAMRRGESQEQAQRRAAEFYAKQR